MIWCSSCFPRQFRFEMGLSVIFVVSVAFVVLLLAWDARNILQDPLDEDTQQVSMKTCSLLWKVVKENRRPLLSIALLLVCLLMLSSWSPRKRGPERFSVFSHYQVCCWNRSTSNVCRFDRTEQARRQRIENYIHLV